MAIQENDILSGRPLVMSFPNNTEFEEGITIFSSDKYFVDVANDNDVIIIAMRDVEDTVLATFYAYNTDTQTTVTNLSSYTLPDDFGIVNSIDTGSDAYQYITAIMGTPIVSDTLDMSTYGQAARVATNYMTWSAEYGLVISEDATEDVTQMQGGNTRIISDGMEVYKGQTLLAHFGRDVALYSSAGVPLVYFGYARGESGNSGQYYTLGHRVGEVDNFSCALGYKVEASGIRSIAMNHGTIAASPNQVAIGKYNKADRIGDYAFIIGSGNGYSGDVYERRNALTVDWSGSVTHFKDGTDNIISNIHRSLGATVTRCTATLYDKVCQLVLGLEYSTSVGSGANIFEGNMGGHSGYEPKEYVTGVGYYGGHAIVGRITSNGEIVVRNASSSAVTITNEVLLSFTYVRNA